MSEDFDYRGRCDRARALMKAKGVDYLFITISPDLRYLTGYQTWLLPRITLFVLPKDDVPFMLVPSFEASKLEAIGFPYEIVTWTETKDPIDVLRSRLGLSADAHVTIGVADTMWSLFLLPLMGAFRTAAYKLASEVLAPLRMIKDPQEISCLRKAQSMVMEGLNRLAEEPFSGRTEHEIAERLRELCEEVGLEVMGLAIVASGPNAAFPHYHFGERVIVPGDVVLFDAGGAFKGYRADISRSFHVGLPSEEFLAVYEIVRQAQEHAIRASEPGVTCEAVDQAGRAVIEAAGYGEFFTHRIGHGIGLEEHEQPYLVNGNKQLLVPGVIHSVEPGIYLPGRFGVRIEDLVVVTESGAERLGEMSRELVVVA